MISCQTLPAWPVAARPAKGCVFETYFGGNVRQVVSALQIGARTLICSLGLGIGVRLTTYRHRFARAAAVAPPA